VTINLSRTLLRGANHAKQYRQIVIAVTSGVYRRGKCSEDGIIKLIKF